MPSQDEEVLIPADLCAPEQFGPHICDGLLQRCPGRLECAIGRRGLVRERQRGLVHLAVGCEREGVEDEIGSRDHVVGQTAGQMISQGLSCDRLAGNEIGSEEGIAASGQGDSPHQSVLHRWMLLQRMFDLPRLDAEAA